MRLTVAFRGGPRGVGAGRQGRCSPEAGVRRFLDVPWQPWLGAVPSKTATTFRVWAPKASALSVRVVDGPTAALTADGEGYYSATLEGVRPGARYLYRFPDGRERPDPASLSQPEGVHGPSEVIDLAAIAPKSKGPGTELRRLVFSEIHLGTFTAGGTAESAVGRFRDLREAGFTAVEVMPVAAFPGARNWGYDGVAAFAAHSAYGGPAGLARLVDGAHAEGICAFLDVVYNHFGPEG
ncbi:MAG: alpha-amylase family glycosyl hydrolase, partial [Myxococcales bacterium]